MKLALLLFLSVACTAQTSKPIDWESCKSAIKPFEHAVQKFNEAYVNDGLEIQLYCTFSNPAPHKPEKHIPLSAAEAKQLRSLRARSDVAFDAQTIYEQRLIKRHYPSAPDGNCPYFHTQKSTRALCEAVADVVLAYRPKSKQPKPRKRKKAKRAR